MVITQEEEQTLLEEFRVLSEESRAREQQTKDDEWLLRTRKLRELSDRGVRQVALAAVIGVSPPTVCRWLKQLDDVEHGRPRARRRHRPRSVAA